MNGKIISSRGGVAVALPAITLLVLSALAGCTFFVPAYANMGNAVIFEGQRNYAECLKQSNIAVRKDPEYGPPFGVRARCYAKLHKDNEALADAKKSLALDPVWGVPYLYSLMAEIYCRQKNIEEGLRMNKKALAGGLDAAAADKFPAVCDRLANPAGVVDASEEEAFEAEAARYRALAVKPALPESARKFKIQAESAVRKKRFDHAVYRYSEALKIAPWWPEGHFNRALILGELKRYPEAIREMKRYLKLVPNAADARKAKEKIYEWEDN